MYFPEEKMAAPYVPQVRSRPQSPVPQIDCDTLDCSAEEAEASAKASAKAPAQENLVSMGDIAEQLSSKYPLLAGLEQLGKLGPKHGALQTNSTRSPSTASSSTYASTCRTSASRASRGRDSHGHAGGDRAGGKHASRRKSLLTMGLEAVDESMPKPHVPRGPSKPKVAYPATSPSCAQSGNMELATLKLFPPSSTVQVVLSRKGEIIVKEGTIMVVNSAEATYKVRLCDGSVRVVNARTLAAVEK
mmetsp:Transcript_72882/g.206135  ORF Transcript_72882/g.206135 Transcript_72882/m.206135 type:complete len:246 (-) Transcript_72882:484-1221(-)